MNQHITSDRLIGHHRSRQDYVQSHINTLQFGYGDRRYQKMTFQLLNCSEVLQQKILKQLIEDFSLCDNVNLAILSSDLLTVVLEHLKNKNNKIRLLSATLFKKVCATPMGRKDIIKRDCIIQFQNLIHDNLVNVRSQTYDGLIAFVQFIEEINKIVEKQIVLNQLVDKLIEQKQQSILLKSVILLKILMQGEQGTKKALKTQIISRLMNLINHNNPQIQYNICMTLANISFNQNGKQAIVSKNHIKTIANYINNNNSLVRQAVTILLTSLAQLNQGKIQILHHIKFQLIQSLLSDKNPSTVLNTVQLIANMAQNPHGRQLASKIYDKLNNINCIQRKYIDQTLEVIKWTP